MSEVKSLPRLTLITKSIPGVGTFGELFSNGEVICKTVEREWLSNRKNKSCVPPGVYRVKPNHSPRFGEGFVLENPDLGVTVKGPSQRTHCLIHVANFPEEVEGCIAPGTDFHSARWGVANSRYAFGRLMELLGGQEWELEIIRH
ncbi:DUF5675 family protein [Photobacterium atrarenae]|uniref:DUF5675 family protein n=1 Tax=Photobacterium atrarenae TaxID=865757 RepID=A0ABY5GI69_9GAMM|nr:DUF5675 family protein [Photobacterium atrarenae]UTV28985.1 DUF5675 family protein [Photobacterium atrarenae]